MEERQSATTERIAAVAAVIDAYRGLPVDPDMALEVLTGAMPVLLGLGEARIGGVLLSRAADEVIETGEGWVRFNDIMAGPVLTWLLSRSGDLPSSEFVADPEVAKHRLDSFLNRLSTSRDRPPSWVIGSHLRGATLQVGRLDGPHTRTLCVSGPGVLLIVAGSASPATLHGAGALVCSARLPLSRAQEELLWRFTQALCDRAAEGAEPSAPWLLEHWSPEGGAR